MNRELQTSSPATAWNLGDALLVVGLVTLVSGIGLVAGPGAALISTGVICTLAGVGRYVVQRRAK